MASVPDDPDRKLALRARQGDREALAGLYEFHKGRLLGFLQKMMGPSGLAEDVFHEVWMKVMKTMHQFQPERGPFRAWLYKTASNAAVDRLRSEGLRSRWVEHVSHEKESSLDAIASPAPGPERALEVRESEWILEHALSRIEPNQRTAILLRHQLGFTYAEISQTLGVPEGTVKSFVHRGIMTVRKLCREKTS